MQLKFVSGEGREFSMEWLCRAVLYFAAHFYLYSSLGFVPIEL
jgi:hypothetical protein